MKKIFALFLSIVLVLGLRPVSLVNADASTVISSEAETYIEAENNLSATIYSSDTDTTGTAVTLNVKTDSSAHESEYALYYNSGEDKYKIAINIPIYVEKAGKYTIQYRAQAKQGWLLSNAFLSVDGEMLVNNASASGDEMVTVQCAAVLSEGEHTITLEGQNSDNAATLQYKWDYIRFAPVPGYTNIALSGSTRIEAENYGIEHNQNDETAAALGREIVDDALSGGKAISTGSYQLASSTTRPYTTIDFPVTIQKTGYYDIKSNLQFIYSGDVCIVDYSLLLDGTRVGVYTNEATDCWATRESRIYLEEGNHIITLHSQVINRGNKHCSIGIDYIEFSLKNINISPDAETIVEAENYDNATGIDASNTEQKLIGVTDPSTVNTSYLSAWGEYSGEGFVWISKGSDTFKSAKWEIPVEFETAGVYKITIRTLQSNTYWGNTKIYFDGKETAVSPSGGNPPSFTDISWSEVVSEGEHIISVENTKNTINVMLCIDCVKFEPLSTSDPSVLLNVEVPDSLIFGEVLNVSYEYTGTNAEGDSILRMVYKDEDEWKEYSTQNTKAGTPVTIELPEKLVNKEIAIELIPVDSQGNYGTLERFDIGVLKRDYNLTPYGTYDTEKDLKGNTYGRAVSVSWIDDGNGGGYARAKNTYENWEFFTPIVIPVVPGETFDITFDAKVDDGQTNKIGFYSVYRNGSGGASIEFSGDKTVSEEWKTFTLTVKNSATDSKGDDLTGDSWTAGVRLITDQHENYVYIDNVVVRPRMMVEFDWDNYFDERWGEMEPLDSDDGFVDEKPEDGTAYKEFYVDSELGSDSYNGLSEGTPVKTIAKAKELVRPYLSQMTGHIYVYIKGEHNLTETVTWGVDDSGQNGYNVIYTSWGDAQPEITMKEDFEGFTLHDEDKNIWKVYVGKDNPARQVYIDGVRGVRAKTDTTESQKSLLINPERIGTLYSKECGFLCDNMDFVNFTNQEDIELIFTEQWTSKRGKVKQIYKVNDETIRIDLQDESWQHVTGSATKNVNIGAPSWIENAYELLDTKGEWYINKKDGYLYYMPRDFENPETMVATIPVGEHAFIIAGNSVDEKIHNIVFDNLAIKYTTWLHPNLYGVNDSQNNFLELYDGDGRLIGGKEDGAVIIADAAYVDIRNCTLAHLGGGGIFYREVFQGCEVVGNHIYDMSGTGVNMGLTTWEGKDFYKYIRTTKYKNYLINNKINNNLIHDVGVEYRSASAVSVSYVMNTEIKYNEIYNSSYTGIHLGGGMDGTSYGRITALQGVEVMYNYIHDVMDDLVYDGGAFYVFGHCGGECTVAYNYFENQRNYYAPLYFDTGTDMWQVHNNVIDLSESPTWAGGAKVGKRGASGWLANGPFFGLSEDFGSVYDNYSTTDVVTVNTPERPEDKYEAPTVCESGAWPEEAQAVIDASGLQSEYITKYADSIQRIRVLNEEKDYHFLNIGETLNMEVTAYYRKLNEASDLSDMKYYSSNQNVATVSADGVITAVGNGQCGIYAEILDGDVLRTQNINIVVGDNVKEIKSDISLISLFTGDTFDLSITAKTEYGQTATIIPAVSLDTTELATYSNGVLTAVSEGNTIAHITYTSGDVTVTKDVPLYVVNGYNRGDTTEEYIDSGTKITSGSDFLNADNWTGNTVASGTGISVQGTTHNYMPAYYKNKLTDVISFNMTINDPMSWPSIFLKAKDITKDHQDGYMITFKEGTVELHRFENGERTTIFGESIYNPIGGEAFTNSYKYLLWTQKYYEYGTSVKVTVGTVDEDDGVRIILCIKDKPVFDYLDREAENLKGDGYFGIYEWAGNFTISAY